MISSVISNCDVDLRKDLFSLFEGFSDRVQRELQSNAPQMYREKLLVSPDVFERKYASWIGGSILGSLGSFHQMWMSKQEYDEFGKSLVGRKCP